MADEEGTIDGIAEDDLVDDAEVDTMIREAITQVRGAQPPSGFQGSV